MIRVQSMPFDSGGELNTFSSSVAGVGAIVSFTGVVRDVEGGLSNMIIEHYPGMTEKALEAIRSEAMQRWDLADILIVHRTGLLEAHESIMMVATASKHRKDAFEAAEFLMDYLKSRAPFWKKEITLDGADWVASKSEDEDALSRW
ncbi:MAG: molybdenum cofactor biosynthesis protein MoaE [Octadecabacter sp.]|nr:molybdenum cofactor biosynthesis protein MoaE [Octadecabacter sp.]